MAGSSNACSPEQPPRIWLAWQPEAVADGTPCWLTRSEQDIVARFSGPRRREYLHSRWLIRQALAHSAGCEPVDCEPVPGRPVASVAPVGWHLSLSHSHGLSGCATGQLSGLGLDLEPLARRPDWQRVVRRWFTPGEQNWLLAHGSQRDFLQVWTLKEAWLKATRRGIANHLQTLDVAQDYQLTGDDPDADWHAALGHLDTPAGEGFLVTLVYRSPQGLAPEATVLPSPQAKLALSRVETVAGPGVTWLWHRRIRPATVHGDFNG